MSEVTVVTGTKPDAVIVSGPAGGTVVTSPGEPGVVTAPSPVPAKTVAIGAGVGPQGEQGPQGIQGPVGPQGDTGPQGERGLQGEPGPQGIQGIQGIQGETGPQGEQGIQGETGETGPQGLPGVDGYENYVHHQMVAAAEWTITHNLDRFPSVTIVDSGGTMIVGDLVYLDSNRVRVSFSAAFGGTAYVN